MSRETELIDYFASISMDISEVSSDVSWSKGCCACTNFSMSICIILSIPLSVFGWATVIICLSYILLVSVYFLNTIDTPTRHIWQIGFWLFNWEFAEKSLLNFVHFLKNTCKPNELKIARNCYSNKKNLTKAV